MGKAENYVEGYLVKRTKAAGGMCLKFISGVNGVPDRCVILAGQIVFVETKSPKGEPSKIQLVRHREMRTVGADVRVIDTRALVDELIIELTASEDTRREDAAA